jgi:hypothetical protein
MNELIISRTSQYANKLRAIDIYVDNIKVDSINDGEEKIIKVSPQIHTVFAKIDWCKSKTLTINLTENKQIKLICGSKLEGIKAYFALFLIFFKNQFVFLDDYPNTSSYMNKNTELSQHNYSMKLPYFIFKNGILKSGIPLGCIFFILNLFFIANRFSFTSILTLLLENIIIFSLIGSIASVLKWLLLKKSNC